MIEMVRSDIYQVYVAPMKALAAEIVEKLGSRLAWLKIQVRELTGMFVYQTANPQESNQVSR